jgi:hypothetical protein
MTLCEYRSAPPDGWYFAVDEEVAGCLWVAEVER